MNNPSQPPATSNAFRIAPADAIDFSKVRRVLVIKLRNFGDVLLTSSVFTALKTLHPHIATDALVYEDCAPMLAGHPCIEKVITLKRIRGSFPRTFGTIKTAFALRRRQYDLVIHLTTSSQGAWISRIAAHGNSVAPEKSGRFFRKSFTHLYPLAAKRHTVETHLDALRRLGVNPIPAEAKKLSIYPDDRTKTKVRALLDNAGIAHGSYVVLHPGSRWFFKCLPPEQPAALADLLARDGHKIIVTGAPDAAELRLLEAIIAQMKIPPALNLAGNLSLHELAALIAGAKLFVGADSAPMHIAAATGTPCVAMFGPSSEAVWGPWMVPARVICSPEFPCRPCGKDGCGGGKFSECLAAISVSRMKNACDELLAEVAG